MSIKRISLIGVPVDVIQPENLENEILELQRQPEIEGCYSACFEDEHGNQGDIFAVAWDDIGRMSHIKGFRTIDRL